MFYEVLGLKKWANFQNTSPFLPLCANLIGLRLRSNVQFISRYGRQPPVEPTSPIAMSLNEAGHHHDQNLSGSRSGQILWIRGLTRLQTQVGTSKNFFFFWQNIFFFILKCAQAFVKTDQFVVTTFFYKITIRIFVEQHHHQLNKHFCFLNRGKHILCTVYTITAISVLPYSYKHFKIQLLFFSIYFLSMPNIFK